MQTGVQSVEFTIIWLGYTGFFWKYAGVLISRRTCGAAVRRNRL